jgi:hypothetical protein
LAQHRHQNTGPAITNGWTMVFNFPNGPVAERLARDGPQSGTTMTSPQRRLNKAIATNAIFKPSTAHSAVLLTIRRANSVEWHGLFHRHLDEHPAAGAGDRSDVRPDPQRHRIAVTATASDLAAPWRASNSASMGRCSIPTPLRPTASR